VAGLDDDALAQSLRELTDQLAPGTLIGPLSTQLAAVVSAAAQLLGVESVGILLLDDADRIRSVAASSGAAEALEAAQERVGVGPGVDALAQRAMVAVADVGAVSRYGPLWQEIVGCGARAVLAAPIWLAGQVVGNLDAVLADPHVWSSPEKRAAAAVAAVVGQMLGLAARPGSAAGNDGQGSVR
jgi:GAF domain-containing protein